MDLRAVARDRSSGLAHCEHGARLHPNLSSVESRLLTKNAEPKPKSGQAQPATFYIGSEAAGSPRERVNRFRDALLKDADAHSNVVS